MSAPSRPNRKRKLRSCHDGIAVWEALNLVNENASFQACLGHVPVCSKCHKPVGELEMEPKPPKEWTPTSWNMMVRFHPHAPYLFKLHGAQIVPYTWTPGAKEPAAPPTTSAAASAAASESDEIHSEEDQFA